MDKKVFTEGWEHQGKEAAEQRISAGSSCFLVKDDSLKSMDAPFWEWLRDEGFHIWHWHGYFDDIVCYINVNSMMFAPGMPGICVTGTVVSNSYDNAITIDDFKQIWNILKKYRKSSTNDAFDDERKKEKVRECLQKVLEIIKAKGR